MTIPKDEFSDAWSEGEDPNQGLSQASIDAAEQVRQAKQQSDDEYEAAHREEQAAK